MIIAVNTRLLLAGKIEGIGRFTLETLKIITKDHPEHKFVFIFDRKFDHQFVFSSNINPVICFPQARHPFLWYWYFEQSIPQVLKKYKADLFFSPDGWLSLKADIISLPVIHDLNFIHFPEFMPFLYKKYMNYFFPEFIKKANRIATVSQYTKEDIFNLYSYPKTKIDIVYNGTEGFFPLDDISKSQVQKKYSNGEPYFLSVGLIHPRKNITNLIKSYDKFKNECPGSIKLLIVGARKWWTSEMQKAYDESLYKQDIIFTGRVSEEELKKITSSAFAMLYISFFEGFGIPVLEAMHAGVPVICSSTSSLPEVGGDSVLYVDPSNIENISEAMKKVFTDPILRNDLIIKGNKQKEKFNWKMTADLLWNSIEKTIEENN